MTIYLEMSEKNSGFMNGEPLYDTVRNTAWDGDTMTIDVRHNGDEMSMSMNKADVMDILGRSCHKSPLEKRLGQLLTTRKTRANKRKRCKTVANTRRRNRHKQKIYSSHRRTASKCRSHRPTRRRKVTC